MARDEREGHRSLVSTIQKAAIGTVANIFGVSATRTCSKCGELIPYTDSSECGSHPTVTPGKDLNIHISMTPAPPKQEEKPIELVATPPKKINAAFKDTHQDQPKPVARVRTDGGRSRASYVGLRGDSDPFIKAQANRSYHYEDSFGEQRPIHWEDAVRRQPERPEIEIEETPHEPHYTFGE